MTRKPVILLAFANDLQHHGRYLKEVNREMAELGEILDPHALVKLKPSATKEIIENAFQDYEQGIKIFHYGGHAGGQGLETSPTDDVPRITFAKGLADFVGRRKGLKLVFLNGCATKEQVKFFHRSQIPCVIATIRPIQDKVARQFAIRFYRSLSKGQNIKTAFLDARDSLRGIYPEDGHMLTRNIFWEESQNNDQFPYQLLTDPKQIEVELQGLKDWTIQSGETQDPILGQAKVGHLKTYLLCNRDEHNEAFEDPLERTLKVELRKPQFYFLHGPHEELPHSLADRFFVFTVARILKRLAEPIAPGKFVRREMKFPTARDFENKRHPDKATLSLQKHFSNSELGLPKHGRDVLTKLGKQQRVVLLQHNMMAADWHPKMAAFIQRYINEFWQIELIGQQPQIVVVFNLTYHLEKGLSGFLKKRKDNSIQEELSAISERIPHCHFIDRLRPVNRNELAEWQNDYLPQHTDLLQRINWRKNRASMQSIEAILRKILQQTAEESG